MKISMIMPLSGNYKDKDRAIISCLNQTYKNIEILICLNGNTETYNKSIVQRFKEYKKIKFYVKNYNNIVDALNYLIDKATGKYTARIDADDICKHTRIEQQVAYIKLNKSDFVSANCRVISDNDKFLYTHKTNMKKKVYTNPIIHPSIMVKTKILKQFKYKHIPYAEDYELYQRLERANINLKNIDKELVFYRQNDRNIGQARRSFFLNISTLVISKCYRDNLRVNENFFKLINFEKKLKKAFLEVHKNSLKKNKILKIVSILKSMGLKNNNLYEKKDFNYLYYFFGILNNNLKKEKKYKFPKNPFISIIVPTYNSEKTIIKTLDSILNQTYQNFEIILVDNSSDKKTINLIKDKYKKNNKIKKIIIEKKILSGEARNIGAKHTKNKTKFLAFCDADDVWKRDKLSYQIEQMEKNNSSLSCTNYDFYDPKSNKYEKNFFKIPFIDINFSILAYKNILGTSSVVVEKKLFEKVKGFPESNFFYSFEDYFLWLKLAKIKNFLFIDKNLTIYRDDRKNSASKHSLNIVSQRIRILIYFLINFNIGNVIQLIFGNLRLLKEYLNKKDKIKIYEEYFNLL
jgi:teichuronic acid biosynthesis glycosyltransferase TuaG